MVELSNPRLFPSVITAIAGLLLRSSSSVESLTITPYDLNTDMYWGQSAIDVEMVRVVGLERLLAEDVSSTGMSSTKPNRSFLSKLVRSQKEAPVPKPLPAKLLVCQYSQLKKVIINSNRVGLSAAVVPYLPSLNHVETSNTGPGNIDDSFWKALTKEKVRLEYLKVWPITRSMAQYLSSYSGLKTIHLRNPEGAAAGSANVDETDRLLTVILPRHHGQTLDSLWLEGPNSGYSGFGGTGFYLTEKTLEGVTSCPELRSLSISYYFPPSERVRRMNQEVSDQRPVGLVSVA